MEPGETPEQALEREIWKELETRIVVENPDNLPLALFDDAKIDITSLIYAIRGQKVMLDRDLATLYGVKTLCAKGGCPQLHDINILPSYTSLGKHFTYEKSY